jgi:predicted nuclease of predicted toxin-antitoxin system
LKLLLDHNLSPRLVEPLSATYPATTHVALVGLDRADDEVVWRYARDNGYLIVTKDSDFHERSVLYGAPPKVVWIRRGNCTTRQILDILRNHAADIETLGASQDATFLILV